MQYLLDEHVPHALAEALMQREPALRLLTVGWPEAPPLGTPDPELLSWCELAGFALVTNNRRTMPKHLANHLKSGRHVIGIFMLSAGMSLQDTANELVLIAQTVQSAEYADAIHFLPLKVFSKSIVVALLNRRGQIG